MQEPGTRRKGPLYGETARFNQRAFYQGRVAVRDLGAHLENLHAQGFTYEDIARKVGCSSRVLWGIRVGDELSIQRELYGRIDRLTIADKPRIPAQKRRTPTKLAGQHKANAIRAQQRPEYRKQGIICPACGAHVCPLDCHGKTCGRKECVNALKGRRKRPGPAS